MGELLLNGDAPPPTPYLRSTTMAFRCSPELAGWVRSRADDDGCTPGEILRRTVTAARRGSKWAPDVHEWLLRQAAQCGIPGDPDGAVEAVVRHLAARYPRGVRLTS